MPMAMQAAKLQISGQILAHGHGAPSKSPGWLATRKDHKAAQCQQPYGDGGIEHYAAKAVYQCLAGNVCQCLRRSDGASVCLQGV